MKNIKTKKKRKLSNPINKLLIEKRVRMTITPTKKELQNRLDRIQKQKGYGLSD